MINEDPQGKAVLNAILDEFDLVYGPEHRDFACYSVGFLVAQMGHSEEHPPSWAVFRTALEAAYRRLAAPPRPSLVTWPPSLC